MDIKFILNTKESITYKGFNSYNLYLCNDKTNESLFIGTILEPVGSKIIEAGDKYMMKYNSINTLIIAMEPNKSKYFYIMGYNGQSKPKEKVLYCNLSIKNMSINSKGLLYEILMGGKRIPLEII